jgi:hypothetical protein
MKFLPLLDLQVIHTYYADKLCPDFAIAPTSDTDRRLRNHRCTITPLGNGTRLFTAVTAEGKPLIPLPAALRLAFHLRLRNPDFALVTEPTQMGQPGVQRFTKQAGDGGAPVVLALQSLQAWTTDRFLVQQPSAAEPYVLHGRPQPGVQTTDFVLKGAISVTAPASFDEAAKLLTVNSSGRLPGDAFTVTYPSVPALPADVWAEVEIFTDDALTSLAQGPGQFHITFNARPARWIYYVITDAISGELTIQDSETSAPISFSPANRTHFNGQLEGADALVQRLAQQYPNRHYWRFISDGEVVCQERARKSLQLFIDSEAVLKALPTPSPRNDWNFSAGATGNGATPTNGSLYQVVTYFSESLIPAGG